MAGEGLASGESCAKERHKPRQVLRGNGVEELKWRCVAAAEAFEDGACRPYAQVRGFEAAGAVWRIRHVWGRRRGVGRWMA